MNTNNPTLEQNLADITGWIRHSLEVTTNFAAEQTPLYVNELIAWEFWKSLIVFCACLAGTAITIPWALDYWRKEEIRNEARMAAGKHCNDVIPIKGIVITGVAAVLSMCLPIWVSEGANALKAKVAPRVLILDKLKEKVQ